MDDDPITAAPKVDSYSVIGCTMTMLANRGIRATLTGRNVGAVREAAEALLAAFGVASATVPPGPRPGVTA